MSNQYQRFLSFLLFFALLAGASPAQRRAKNPVRKNSVRNELKLDLLIKGGTIIDGSMRAPVKTDIGIRGDRIVFIGNSARKNVIAAGTLDAAGMIIAPGFIDPHTHALEDLSNPKSSANENYLMQGVTTVVTGNDGDGPIRVAETLEKWERQGIGINAALLVGHGTIRREVVGNGDVAPSIEQLAQMKNLTRQAMNEGTFGMSTGLFYAPGSYAKTEEVIELAKTVAESGGIYDTHMRDEGSYSIGLLGSIRETIRIGREAKIPVHISHIKALGTEVWGQSREAIRLIKQARVKGVKITANQYPYTASGTNITAALVPRWAEAGGAAQLLERIKDPQVRPRLVAEMEANLKRRNGAEAILITRSQDKRLVGKTLGALAKEWEKAPVEAALDIVASGGAGIASFNMNESDIENFMKQDFVMTGSDGSSGHPRKYGTFPRKLREYVFEKKLIALPFAVRASSALTAETFRIPERGRLRVGYFADVIVFDPKTVRDRATYEQPETPSTGMKFVIVNGKIAVDEGKYTGISAGRPLRKTLIQVR
ncbi:MAG TPA: D-aminoacylase [Pyrinomonadaceae bacterium]|nr:D-aminoacylase [Pyrinomonadaceae bacterium]